MNSMPPLKRTESYIFELPPGPDSNTNTSVPLAYVSPTPAPVSTNDSASIWVSLPPPAPISPSPKSLNGPIQYSSPLGPSPRKLFRRPHPQSLPKPNLYRRALIACAERAAQGY